MREVICARGAEIARGSHSKNALEMWCWKMMWQARNNAFSTYRYCKLDDRSTCSALVQPNNSPKGSCSMRMEVTSLPQSIQSHTTLTKGKRLPHLLPKAKAAASRVLVVVRRALTWWQLCLRESSSEFWIHWSTWNLCMITHYHLDCVHEIERELT